MTSSRPTRLNCWKIMAQRARHAISARPLRIETSSPSNRICPPVGSASRLSRSEEHTSELQSLMRISYAVFCLKKKTHTTTTYRIAYHLHYCTLYNKPQHD